jgi:hypothetical protein
LITCDGRRPRAQNGRERSRRVDVPEAGEQERQIAVVELSLLPDRHHEQRPVRRDRSDKPIAATYLTPPFPWRH